MKRTLAGFTGILFSLFIAAPAFAQTQVNICPNDPVFAKLCTLTGANFTQVVGGVISLLLIAAVIVAIVFLVWGGIKWIFSGGDKAAVESARNHIVAAIIGLIIALVAYFLLTIILGLFGINVTTFTLPTLIN